MKKFIVVLMVVACVLLLISNASAQKGKKEAIAWPSKDIKWKEIKGGPGPDRSVANLWGDMEKGAYGAFVKLPAGMNNPLHIHTATLKLIVLSGTFWYQPEGGEKKVLDAGSYLMMPANVKHYSGTGDQGATVFQEGTGAFDLKPVGMDKK